MGKRATIYNCSACGKRHEVWIPGDDYLIAGKKYGYVCPDTGEDVEFIQDLREAGELGVPPEEGDVEGHEVAESEHNPPESSE